MELEEAIGILKVYNLWRRDNTGYIEMSITPKELGIAIDTVVNNYENE